MQDVREYEGKMQKETNSRVLDGVDLPDTTEPLPTAAAAATASNSSS